MRHFPSLRLGYPSVCLFPHLYKTETIATCSSYRLQKINPSSSQTLVCLLCSVVYLRQNTAETTAYNSVSNNIEYWLGNHAWEMSFPFKTCINGLKVYIWASLVAQLVKNRPPKPETWVWSLGWEDPLEKGKATNYSILTWRIPWTV